MQVSTYLRRSIAVSCLMGVMAAGSAWAQAPAAAPSGTPAGTTYKPSVGQAGKDVVWVPSPQTLVDRMLDMAKVTDKDYVVDLGSGDGRTVITAAKRGATALGIEYNPDLVQLATENARKEGVSDKATFIKGDIFESDFTKADVVTLFLLPSLNVRLRPILLDMKPGTRVVSNTFDMGDWKPDDVVQATGECTSYCRASFWVVPAKVEGTWKSAQGDMTLDQTYQFVSGSIKTPTGVQQISDGKLTGPQIAFTAGGAQYSGTVNGNAITGTRKGPDGETKWEATKG